MERGRQETVPRRVVESSRRLTLDQVDRTAERLAAIAKPTRVALLAALSEGEAGVQELADEVGVPHQNVSHHLALLWRAGILDRRREANTTVYWVEDWSAWWVVEQIAGLLGPDRDE